MNDLLARLKSIFLLRDREMADKYDEAFAYAPPRTATKYENLLYELGLLRGEVATLKWVIAAIEKTP